MASTPPDSHSPPPVSDERAAEVLANDREDRRWNWAVTLRTLAVVVVSVALGTFLMAWSVHTTDSRYAGAAFWSGLIIGNGGVIVGMLMSLSHAVRRERGH